MKVKSIIETKNCEYATLVDIDTMYNHFNDPYFMVNVAMSFYEKEVHYFLPYMDWYECRKCGRRVYNPPKELVVHDD